MPATQMTAASLTRNSTSRLSLIGSDQRREFAALRTWLRSKKLRTAEFDTIEAALEDDRPAAAADLTIVMQSWPDQFSSAAANQLIGQTLFSRLFCCYGPACESDGRNRNIWPDAIRVPLRLAASVIEQELRDALDGKPPLPPTAARDEIFAHRSGAGSDWEVLARLPQLSQMNGAVISPDRTLRKTIVTALKEFGMRSLDLPLIAVCGKNGVKPKETSRGPVHVVIHDLDPWSHVVETSLQSMKQMFPSATVLGLGSMPDAGLAIEVADQDIKAIIPKLDLEHGLRWQLQQMLKK